MGVMREEDRFHELLQRTIRELEPPPAPREELWARIAAERAARRAGAPAQPDVIPFRRRLVRPWLAWSVALAATLVIGIGLGRISLQERASDAGSRQVTGSAPPVDSVAGQAGDSVPTPYRLVATQHLQRTEALLT